MKKAWILKLLGIAIFIFILTRLDLKAIFAIFSQSRWWLLLAVTAALSIVNLAARAYKWKVLLDAQDISLPFPECFRIITVTAFLATITPGRLGEFARVFYLRQKGHSVAKSSVSVFIDRAQDISYIIVFGSLGIILFSGILLQKTVLVAYTCLALLLVFAALMFSRKTREGLFRLMIRVLPKKYRDFVSRHMERFLGDLRKVSIWSFIYAMFISLCLWLMTFSTIYVSANILGISISFLWVCLISALSTLVSLIPISISGLGTRDAVVILVFQQIGLSAEQAVAFSSVFLLIYLEFSVIGFIAWMKDPVRMKNGL